MAPAVPPPSAISLRDAVALSGRFPLLSGLDLEVARGEAVLVEGPNGAGKTSLLRVCAGLVATSAGSVEVLGLDPVADRAELRRRVGLLSHATHLYDDLTVRENLHFSVAAAGADPARIEGACARWQLEGRLLRTPASRLSAGQRRRVAIAGLTARWPELWLLDEPHAGLDAGARATLDSLLGEVRAGGATVVLASHEADAVGRLAGRVVTVSGGRVTASRHLPCRGRGRGPGAARASGTAMASGTARASGAGMTIGAGMGSGDPEASLGAPTAGGHLRPRRWAVWRDAGLVATKDLRIELRSRVALSQIVPFGVVALVLFAFALGPDRATMAHGAPGLFWVAVLFCTVLAVQRSVSVDAADGARDGLRLAGLDPAGQFFGKAGAVGLELLVLEAVLAVGVLLLYGVHVDTAWLLVVSCLLGTVGLASTGTLYGALSAGLKVRETLLPFLLLPIVAPVLLAGTRIWQAALAGGTASDGTQWLRLLVVFDAVYLALGTVVYGPIVESA